MLIREEYSFGKVKDYLDSNITCIIVGKVENECDERNKFIYDYYRESKIAIIKVYYIDDERKFDIEISFGDQIIQQKKVDAFGIINVIKLCPQELFLNVLIDLTSLQHISIMCVTKTMIQYKPMRLFASYARPDQYIEYEDDRKYSLSLIYGEPQGVPGLTARYRRQEVLIPFLGFEEQRLNNIIGDKQYYAICPIIGFPSDEPFWQFEALRNNMYDIKTNNATSSIRKCRAYSVFDVYSEINNIKKAYREQDIVIAPIGSRPHTMGCTLFAIANKCKILYDYVIEENVRTIGLRDVIVYHLSNFI